MKTVEDKVEVKVGKNVFYGPFTKVVFETREDVLEAIKTDSGVKDVIGHINYSIDLGERGTARQKVLAGPAKAAAAEEKAINDLVTMRNENGMPTTKDEARQILEFMKTMKVPTAASA